MTTLHEYKSSQNRMKIGPETGRERRQHRRHDMETQQLVVERWDGKRQAGQTMGTLVDLSAGGVRIRTNTKQIRPDHQLRLRIALPAYAGISPFLDTTGEHMQPKNEWIGWMAVSRVKPLNDGEVDVAGRLIDMDEMDRGMLGLYLSTQPLAA